MTIDEGRLLETLDPDDADARSRSFRRAFTSFRTPSNARKRVELPTAKALPIASRVGASCSSRCRS